MRKIEQAMLDAVARNESAKLGNTIVSAAPDRSIVVTLHGNVIARRTPMGHWSYTLAGWDTPTTRSRVRALGANLTSKNGRRYANGVEVSASDWF